MSLVKMKFSVVPTIIPNFLTASDEVIMVTKDNVTVWVMQTMEGALVEIEDIRDLYKLKVGDRFNFNDLGEIVIIERPLVSIVQPD